MGNHEYYLSNLKSNNSKFEDIKVKDSSFYKSINSNDYVYIQGGDGTLNNFINKLCENKPNIVLDPKGTGNDYARMLTDQFVNSSYYSVNDKVKFINGFGVGFDADVCDLVNKSTTKSQLVYLSSAMKSIKHMKPYNLNITVDNEKYNFEKVLLTVVQNGKYIGNGMKVAPNANIEDDNLEICVVHNVNKIKFVLLLPLVFIGMHTKIKKNVTILKGKDIYGKTNLHLKAQCEGEVFDLNEFKIQLAGKIKIKKQGS